MVEAFIEMVEFALPPIETGLVDSSRWRPLAAATAASTSSHYDETKDCEAGGTIHTVGPYSHSGTGSSRTVSLNVVQTHRDCAGLSPLDDSLWTFNGSPSVTIAGSRTDAATEGFWDFDVDGALSFVGAGHDDTCSINFRWTLEWADGRVSKTIRGWACGRRISHHWFE